MTPVVPRGSIWTQVMSNGWKMADIFYIIFDILLQVFRIFFFFINTCSDKVKIYGPYGNSGIVIVNWINTIYKWIDTYRSTDTNNNIIK